MTEKLRIIGSLGEDGILLPSLVNAALSANDRAKYFFALLQAAAWHAEHPDQPATDLRQERLVCGVSDDAWDGVVARSAKLAEGRYQIPAAVRIVARLLDEVKTMLQPLGERDPALGARLAKLRGAAPCAADDRLTAAEIDAMASGNRERGDTLHLLVMDAHKALNALQATMASENIEGASAYGLDSRDRPLVAAFMRGVQRTAPLKFDHPGLATTATRARERLVLQNDIGTTDAHVLVIHVVDYRRVTLTYTDAHLQRLLFFQSLFPNYDVQWEDTRSRRDDALEDGVYHLCIGSFAARDESDLKDYLAFVGSRLVYLIDWNRARKRLQQLVSKNEAIRLLDLGGGARPWPHGLSQGGWRAADLRRPATSWSRGSPASASASTRSSGRRRRAIICVSCSRPAPRTGCTTSPSCSCRMPCGRSCSTISAAGRSSSTTRPPSMPRSLSRSPAACATACCRYACRARTVSWSATPNAPSSGKAAPTRWSTGRARAPSTPNRRRRFAPSSRRPTMSPTSWRRPPSA